MVKVTFKTWLRLFLLVRGQKKPCNTNLRETNSCKKIKRNTFQGSEGIALPVAWKTLADDKISVLYTRTCISQNFERNGIGLKALSNCWVSFSTSFGPSPSADKEICSLGKIFTKTANWFLAMLQHGKGFESQTIKFLQIWTPAYVANYRFVPIRNETPTAVYYFPLSTGNLPYLSRGLFKVLFVLSLQPFPFFGRRGGPFSIWPQAS